MSRQKGLLLLFFLVVFLVAFYFQDRTTIPEDRTTIDESKDKLSWLSSIEEGKKEAKKSQKPVFVKIGEKW